MTALPQVFVLDTGVFIEPHKKYYPFDICPGYWDCLARHQNRGKIITLDKVLDEINRGNDNDKLRVWANNMPKSFFAPSGDTDIIQRYSDLVNWVQASGHFTDSAKEEFMKADNADGFLLAYAKAKGGIVITEEKSNPAVKSRIKIPDVGKQFGIKCCDIQWMLRKLGARFTNH